MKSYFLLIGVCFLCLKGIAQRSQDRIITDDGHQYRYTDSMGTTASFIDRFGDSIALPPLVTLDDKTLEAADLRGKTVVLNFWFTGCKPCVAEMPVLNRLAAAYRNDPVVFIGITFDSKEKVEKFLTSRRFDFSIARLPLGTIQKLKGVSLFPFTMIMDKHQRLSFVIFGRQAKDNDDEAFFNLLDSQVKNALRR